jgi:hypothetical protein
VKFPRTPDLVIRAGSPGPARLPAARRRKALAVVELLIALAISGMVLAAVAFALDACFRAYSINQEQSDLIQRSRLAMYRIITTIRTTNAHQPLTADSVTAFKAGLVVSDTGIAMIDEHDNPITYKFDSDNGQVLAVDAAGNEFVVLRGVRRFEIKFEPLRSQQSTRIGGPYDRLLRATVLITVHTTGQSVDIDETVAAQAVTLSTSVIPRRNIW